MVAKMHRMHLPKIGEGVIYLPGGVPFEADEPPKYPAGSYVRLGNKEFIYAIAGDTLNPDMGAMNSYKQKVVRVGCVVDSVTGENVAAGSMVVGVAIVTGSGLAYLAYEEGVEEDEFKGGQFIGFPGDKTFTRGIVGNTALAKETEGSVYFTLDSPIPVGITAGKWCEAIRNPYGAVKNSQGKFAMVMGMPTVVATKGRGLWLQVSGPGWAAPDLDVGKLANNQEVVFVYNGSINLRSATHAGDSCADCQHAGVCIALADGEQGSMMIMLQIAH